MQLSPGCTCRPSYARQCTGQHPRQSLEQQQSSQHAPGACRLELPPREAVRVAVAPGALAGAGQAARVQADPAHLPGRVLQAAAGLSTGLMAEVERPNKRSQQAAAKQYGRASDPQLCPLWATARTAEQHGSRLSADGCCEVFSPGDLAQRTPPARCRWPTQAANPTSRCPWGPGTGEGLMPMYNKL